MGLKVRVCKCFPYHVVLAFYLVARFVLLFLLQGYELFCSASRVLTAGAPLPLVTLTVVAANMSAFTTPRSVGVSYCRYLMCIFTL